MRARAFKDQERSSAKSGTRRAIGRLVGNAPDRSESFEACKTLGHRPRLRGGTKGWPGLSPSLRGCYADPIEVALEEHTDRMPPAIPSPGQFETRHHYSYDPSAWPREVKVVTVCRGRSLTTYVLQPSESLGVFGGR